MNSEIEQRIVAMYFDNQDFEKNAKQTINTLGELRDNLNLEESTKGFDELNKAGKKLNFAQARNTVNNLKTSLTGMKGAIEKAFDIGTAPLQSLDNFFNTFRSYVGKFVGFDLAGKFVSSLENAMRQLTVAPIEAGWNMYQSMTDSTKTIMSGTLKSYEEQMSKANENWKYDEAEHMEYVEGELQKLSEYAQQTVFSLSDMTNNVGKFTNQNIGLEESVQAMEGIANMTAKAGQGAQQASMAMYNFSQALGVGKLTSIDWKSIETANIATTELKDLFIETAAASGQLTKEIETLADGTQIEKYYKTTDKNGKKLARSKWTEITAEKFRDSLQEGWLDKDTMMKVFQIYSGEINDIDTLAAMGFDTSDTELVEQLFKIGEQAKQAATEVRTFQKMWDALTESVQSGWADSFKLVFGNMQEATIFWTELNKKFDGILSESSNKRNTALNEWRGFVYDEEKGWVKIEGAIDGRDDLIAGFFDLFDSIHAIAATFNTAWHSIFGTIDGKQLQEITRNFRDFAEKFKTWLGSADDADSRLGKLNKGLRGVFSILKVVFKIAKTGFNAVKKLAAPVTDILLNLFAELGGIFDGIGDMKFGDMLSKIQAGFIRFWNKIKKFFSKGAKDENGQQAASPFEKWVSSMFGSVKDNIKNWLEKEGLSDVATKISNVWGEITKAWDEVANWEFWKQLKTFVTDVWTAITTYFAPGEVTITKRDGSTVTTAVDSPFVQDLNSLITAIKGAWEPIANWPFWGKVAQFVGNTWGWVVSQFGTGKEMQRLPDGEVRFVKTEAPVVKFLDGILEGISTAWNSIMGWDFWKDVAGFLGNTWNWITKTFGTGKEMQRLPDGEVRFVTTEAPAVQFLNGILDSIKGAWNAVTTWTFWGDVAKFLGNTWNWITSQFGSGKEMQRLPDGEVRFVTTEAPVVQFLNGVLQTIKDAWKKITEWTFWGEVSRFLGNTWQWISSKFHGGKEMQRLPDGEVRFIERKAPVVEFLSGILETVKGAWEEVMKWTGWTSIASFLGNTWNWITMQFGTGKEMQRLPDGEVRFVTTDPPVVTFLNSILEKIETAWQKVTGWEGWKELSGFLGNTWTWITNFFKKGEAVASEEGVNSAQKAENQAEQVAEPTEETTGFLKTIIESIADFITKVTEAVTGVVIPEEVTTFIGQMGGFLGDVLKALGDTMERIGHLITGKWDWGEVGALLTTALPFILVKIFELINNRYLSKIDGVDSFASKFFSIAAGIALLAAGIAILSTIPLEKMLPAAGVVAVIGILVGFVAGIIEGIAEQKVKLADAPQTSTERVLTKLIGSIERIAMLAIAMKMLPEIIKTFAAAKKEMPDLSGEDILKTLLGLAGLVGTITITLSVVDKISGKTGIDPLVAMKSALAIVGFVTVIIGGFGLVLTALGGLTHLIDKIGGLEYGASSEQIASWIETASGILTAVMTAVGTGIGDFYRGMFGIKSDAQKTKDAEKLLENLADKVEIFDPEKTSGISRIMMMIGNLSQVVKDVPDAGAISSFAQQLGPLAKGIIKFGMIVSEEFATSKPGEKKTLINMEDSIRTAIDIIKAFDVPDFSMANGVGTKVSYFLEGMRELDQEFTDDDWGAFGRVSKKIVEAFGSAVSVNGTPMQDMQKLLMDNLSAAIRLGLLSYEGTSISAFDATPIVDSIVLALGFGETAIAEAVHAMVQAGINNSGNVNGQNGYTLDGTGLDVLNSLFSEDNTNPLQNFDASTILSQFYGEGGTADNPTSDSMFGILKGISTDMGEIEFPDLSKELSDSFSFQNETGESIDPLEELKTTLASVEAELANAPSFEIKIVPTIDTSKLSEEVIRQTLGDYPISMPFGFQMPSQTQSDYSSLLTSLDMGGVRTRLDTIASAVTNSQTAIVDAVNDVTAQVGIMSATIMRLKIYLDTGVLVGAITPMVDTALGRRARIYGNAGAVNP